MFSRAFLLPGCLARGRTYPLARLVGTLLCLSPSIACNDGASDDRGHDGGHTPVHGSDAGPAADAGTDAATPGEKPLPVPNWDAALPQGGPPLGYAYAEEPGSFKLLEPSVLATAFGVLAADTGNVRLLYTAVGEGDAGAEVEYGSVFLEDAGARYEYPNKAGTFRVAPSVGDALTFVSQPFDYHLYAWVPQEGRTDVGYLLDLASTQTVWAAKFDRDYTAISEGTLTGAVLRSAAEKAPFKLDALTCVLVCSNSLSCAGGLQHLSDLLDCNDAMPSLDSDGNGTKDAYRLRIEFNSLRAPGL